jgi:ligand-binding sensor domain-containing protein
VLWAAAGEGGLLRFAPETGRWQGVELPRPDEPVYWIAQLPDASLWASGNNAIVTSTDGGRQWAPVATGDDDLTDPTAVVQDESGRVWVASSNGVGMYDGGQWRRWQREGELLDFQIGQLIEDPDGRLWALPQYGGTPSVVDPATGRAEMAPGLAEFRVYALAFARDVTWAGTSDGLLRLKGGSQRLLNQAAGLPADEVTTLLATPDTLWIGTVGGLAGYDLRTEQITGTVQALGGQVVDAMLLAPDGALWVGSHWGDEGSHMALYRFAGTEHRRWSNGETPFGADRSWVRALAADNDGGIWASLSNGVHRWDGNTWAEWTGAGGGPTNDIFAFLMHDDAMWAAGDSSRGIYGWNSRDGWQRIRARAATGVINAMKVIRDGALWLATNDGLLRYGP